MEPTHKERTVTIKVLFRYIIAVLFGKYVKDIDTRGEIAELPNVIFGVKCICH